MKKFFRAATIPSAYTVKASRCYNVQSPKNNSFSSPPAPFVSNQSTELIKIANPEIRKIPFNL